MFNSNRSMREHCPYDSDDLTVEECREIARHPGKFEGESAYVPYMWHRIMMWGVDPDSDATSQEIDDYNNAIRARGLYSDTIDPYDDMSDLSDFDRYRYDVTMSDVALFPELVEVIYVILWEDSQGFVHSDAQTTYDAEFASHYVFMGI